MRCPAQAGLPFVSVVTAPREDEGILSPCGNIILLGLPSPPCMCTLMDGSIDLLGPNIAIAEPHS